jgi:hypothetical protein
MVSKHWIISEEHKSHQCTDNLYRGAKGHLLPFSVLTVHTFHYTLNITTVITVTDIRLRIFILITKVTTVQQLQYYTANIQYFVTYKAYRQTDRHDHPCMCSFPATNIENQYQKNHWIDIRTRTQT